MKEVRAFVGHSFSDEDADVVRKFLDIFDRLKSITNFSWDHAQAAEPKLLKDKVLSLIQGKNLFIGICTKKELVVDNALLKSVGLFRSYFGAKRNDYSLKTSDWIIQEIGLAIGKELQIILLLEEGVKCPGSLQGDLEYIPFERNYPEKSFPKLLEMISALVLKQSGDADPQAETESSRIEIEKEASEDLNSKLTSPQPDWTLPDYQYAFVRHLVRDQITESEIISQAYLATGHSQIGGNKQIWFAFCECLRINTTSNGDISKLKNLIKENPSNPEIVEYYARALSHYSDHAGASLEFEKSASIQEDQIKKLGLLCEAAVQKAKSGDEALAFNLCEQLKATIGADADKELVILNALRRIANLAKDDDIEIGVLERIVELDPANQSVKFDLAYKHSENENKDLALFRYLSIPEKERGPSTWNNLGVAFDEFSMPTKAIGAFKKAADMENTLAMANLANNLIHAGFLEEAKIRCDVAIQKPDYHENVPKAIAWLKEIPTTETKKLDTVIEHTRMPSEYFGSFGKCISQKAPAYINESWTSSECNLKVALDGTQFRAYGSYQKGLIPGSTIEISYNGVLRGRSLRGIVKRKQSSGTLSNTLLGDGTEEKKFLMFFVSDTEIKVMERSKGKDRDYYNIKAVVKILEIDAE